MEPRPAAAGKAAAPLRERIGKPFASPPRIEHLCGYGSVMDARPALHALAAETGQLDTVQDLPYFLQKPGLARRIPHLLLFGSARGSESRTRPELFGAICVHEFRPCGLPTGAFAISDRSGRCAVVGAVQDRLHLALQAGYYLMRGGAHIVLLSVQGQGPADIAHAYTRTRSALPAKIGIRSRPHPAYLPLRGSYEATLAAMGQKTRSNLRYYRRRAEQELGCDFLPDANPSLEELRAFNRACMFAVPKNVLPWRLDVREHLREPYLMGLRAKDGRWLSLVGGRRFNESTEILWQMNRGDLPRHSLISAMRAYVLEHEIGRGARRLYVEGGTTHSMHHSFQTEPITDVVFVRSSLKTGVTQFIKRYVPGDNTLADTLTDPEVTWHDC